MAIKTFTTGEVLTAADTNTYLANSGLVFVKSQTIGSGVSSVTITNAFSSTYDNYLIQINGGSATVDVVISLVMGATNTGYYQTYIYTNWNNTVSADSAAGTGVRFTYAGSTGSIGHNMSCEILSPNLAKSTRVSSVAGSGTGYSGFFNGWLNNTTQYTDFTALVTSGTMTGGTITVYGYRKA